MPRSDEGTAAPAGAQRSLSDPQHAAAWLNLSHELNTPAHAILGHVELLLSGAAGPLSSEIRSSVGAIQQAALQLSATIDDVINYAETLPAPGCVKSGEGR